VATLLLDRSLKRVTVVPTDDSLGSVHHRRPSDRAISAWDQRLEHASYSGPGGFDMDARTRKRVEQDVVIGLAGAIAGRMAGDPDAEAGAGSIRLSEQAAAELSKKYGESVTHMLDPNSDYDLAFALLEKVTAGDDEVASAWLGYLEVRARRLIERYWEEVETVANALIERKTLSGAEARVVLQELWNARRKPLTT
jgi:hypothetical protein